MVFGLLGFGLMGLSTYCALHVLNRACPSCAEALYPESLYPALFRLRLIGYSEETRYRSGALRTRVGRLPWHVNAVYGAQYRRHGRCVSRSPDGTEQVVLHWPNPTGTWIEWHETGARALVEHYTDGSLNGARVFWYDNGQMQSREHYRSGRWCAPYEAWERDGQKLTEVTRDPDTRSTMRREWYPSGQLRLVTQWIDGVPAGEWLSFSPDDGDSARLRFPRATGRWATWFSSGNRRLEGRYLSGRRHGRWTSWYRTGEVADVRWYEHGEVQPRRARSSDDAAPSGAARTVEPTTCR